MAKTINNQSSWKWPIRKLQKNTTMRGVVRMNGWKLYALASVCDAQSVNDGQAMCAICATQNEHFKHDEYN